MVVTATQIFDFLDRHSTCSIERYEMSSADFSILRRSLRSIVENLRESDDLEARSISDTLRMLLSEWLTVPVPFDGAILAAVQALGDPDAFEARWGHDIRVSYDAAQRAAQDLSQNENPVRVKLLALIRELRAAGRTFKIYCHKRAAPHFESLLVQSTDPLLEKAVFFHSVKDYRAAEPFDVMIKVGPLRARGWGSAPDAILTAPRFTTLIQVVWSGCADEPSFGYDPVSLAGPAAGPDYGSRGNGVSWKSRVTLSGSPGGVFDDDEFRIFRELNVDRDKRRATLVQIDEEHGILYPPHSMVLSFDPALGAQEPLGLRLPGETLVEGMFVIRQNLHDMSLGEVPVEHGHYSRIWKARLAEEYQKDAKGLVMRLYAAGLDLKYLHVAVANWCKPPTTVIRAPQQKRHFEILMRVLGVDFDTSAEPRHRRASWWQYAWNEIARTRGEAIQAGVHEHENIEEQLLVIMKRLLPDIRHKAATEEQFSVAVPVEEELQGNVMFDKVCLIEEGFFVPANEIKVVCELNRIEQWRV